MWCFQNPCHKLTQKIETSWIYFVLLEVHHQHVWKEQEYYNQHTFKMQNYYTQ